MNDSFNILILLKPKDICQSTNDIFIVVTYELDTNINKISNEGYWMTTYLNQTSHSNLFGLERCIYYICYSFLIEIITLVVPLIIMGYQNKRR